MAERPVVILHGWSDTSRSFRRLARLLAARLDRPVVPVYLADYVTMDDEVTFDDLVPAMTRAWSRSGLPRDPGAVDVIAHSTGGLVIRDWLMRNFATSGGAPVKRILMLAPANFGSALAHKGHAFLGRVVKGWKSKKMFQTGRRLLDGLELASPYQWDLAMRDRFGEADLYGPGRILVTVLTGNRGYAGIAAAANEPGSDGTVRVACASMEPASLEVDFSRNPHKPVFRIHGPVGRTAFRVMERENHATITGGDRGPRNGGTLDAMVEALTVEDAGFDAWCDACDEATDAVTTRGSKRPETHGFQNTVFRVEDQDGRPVTDYFLEFFVRDDDRDWFARMFHESAIRSVHAFGGNRSLRSVYVDCTVLERQEDRKWEGMTMSLTALPEFSRNGLVGYRTFTDADIGGIEIPRERMGEFFRPNRTLLVSLRLRREQSDDLFRIRPPS